MTIKWHEGDAFGFSMIFIFAAIVAGPTLLGLGATPAKDPSENRKKEDTAFIVIGTLLIVAVIILFLLMYTSARKHGAL